MDNKKEQEIPFGAFDSELMHQEINIPEGFEATIEGNKIILTRTESKVDEIRKELLKIFKENKGPIYISLTPQKKSFLISLLEKKTWSEEDERIIKRIDSLLYAINESDFEDIHAWLESLKNRIQPKVELTQLDKNILEAAIAFVEQNNHFNCWRGVDKHTVLSALYSLRPQKQWKPSDEQIKALFELLPTRCSSNPIFSLYNDLKKL